jgi:hypothetical protein
MTAEQKELIKLLVDYINAEDWASVKVLCRGHFLDLFDSVEEGL